MADAPVPPIPGSRAEHLASSPMESPDEIMKVKSVWKSVGSHDSTSG